MRVLGTILVAGLCALGGQAAFAQAPGPMSKGHAHLNGALDCQKCHEGGTGVPEKKCLGCHDHRDLRQRIEAGKGFHADEEVRGKACKDCHAEHKEERRQRSAKHMDAVYEERQKPPRRYKKSGLHKKDTIVPYEPTVKGPVNLVTFTF